jgi:predicted outer membrane repeat protein
LALAGDKVGSTGRAANLFHQGLLLNQKFNDRWGSQLGGDVQIYRNPNQIQLASTTAGVPLIVQNGLGITLSGPLTGTGNATTTNGGAIYTARNFQIARVTYRLNWAGWKSGTRTYPVVFNIQAARNIGIGLPERDALLASFQVGRVANSGDMSFLYVFSSKGANSMISQVTDDDLGTNTGVNIRTHHLRFDYGIAKKITWQSLFYIQSERHSSGDFPNFFVPLNAFTPRQYRIQEQIVFSF